MTTALATMFAMAGVFSLLRLGFARHGSQVSLALDSREADLSHAVMNGAMAAMALAPLAEWADYALWALAAGLAAWFAWCIARPRTPGSLAATGYHFVSVIGMIYAMHLLAHGASPMPTLPPGMDPTTGPGICSGSDHWGNHAQSSGAALVLGLVFLLDGVMTLGPGLLAPGLVQRATAALATGQEADTAPPFARAAYLKAAFAHAVMDFGMAWLLLA